jgi:hypothetical protein
MQPLSRLRNLLGEREIKIWCELLTTFYYVLYIMEHTMGLGKIWTKKEKEKIEKLSKITI